MAWKYVIVRVGAMEIPVIFPGVIVHAQMAESLKDIFAEHVFAASGGYMSADSLEKVRSEVVPVSAGETNILCYSANGFSESLGIASRPQDATIISSHPYTGGHL